MTSLQHCLDAHVAVCSCQIGLPLSLLYNLFLCTLPSHQLHEESPVRRSCSPLSVLEHLC